MRWIVFLVIVAMLGAARSVRAWADHDCVELMVAKADVVVVGELVRTTDATPPKESKSMLKWHEFTVKVKETLVGVPREELKFWAPEIFHLDEYEPRPRLHLFMLLEGKRYAARDVMYGDMSLILESEPYATLSIAEPRSSPETIIGRCYEDWDELYAWVRPYCVRPLAIADVEELNWHEHFNGYRVPVDERSLRVAREWVESPDLRHRWMAIRLLKWKRSPENVEALKKIVLGEVNTEEEEVVREGGMYLVRGWSISPSEPARVPAASLVEFGRLRFWFSVLGLLLAPGIYCWLIGRGILGGTRWWRVAVLGWLVLGSLVGVVWVRSYWQLDGVTGGRWVAGSANGSLFLVSRQRPDVAVHWPWAYGRASDFLVPGHEERNQWEMQWTDWSWFSRSSRAGSLKSMEFVPDIESMRWMEVEAWDVPYWPMGAGLCAVALMVWGLRWTRRWVKWLRERRWQGFPVEIDGDAGQRKA